MALDFTRIIQSVDGLTSASDGFVAILADISQKLKDALAQSDPQATQQLEALATLIDAQKQKLADAAVAHTPSA